MLTPRLTACATLPLLLFAACACQSPLGDTVRVDLFVSGDQVLQDVYVTAGEERQWFQQLGSNERGTFQLRLKKPALLFVKFRIGSKPFTWVSETEIDPAKIRVVQLELSEKKDPPVKGQFLAR